MPSTLGIPMPPGMSDAAGPTPQITTFPQVDSFSVANFTLPGKWTLVSAEREFTYQIQVGYGLSFANILPKGIALVVAKFRGEFWAPVDYAFYKEVRKAIFANGPLTLGPVSAAMGITHPELAALNVHAVLPLKIHATIDAGGGLWVAGLDFLEWRTPIPVPPKPKFVVPDVARKVPVAQTKEQAEIAKLGAEATALKGKL